MKQGFVFWSNLELILKQIAYPLKRPCLILLRHHQNHHTFTFSPFLMMTIKWFLFRHHQDMHDSHFPLCQVNSFWHHQNQHDLHSPPFFMMTTIIQGLIFLTSSKFSWFTFSPFLMMTTTCRLGATTTKNIYLYIVLLPLGFGMFAYMRQLKIS